eukprot:TRINITY_DN9729_c0_g1_i1.p1 TRINITY_DN9729_c0_g1~~TRINITY_DN9729_c0_g1_i1.p1  ORF type:complete len:844 (+),score=149.12 TRINITY_DN9729_c0_g1_i1:65-2596(+)
MASALSIPRQQPGWTAGAAWAAVRPLESAREYDAASDPYLRPHQARRRRRLCGSTPRGGSPAAPAASAAAHAPAASRAEWLKLVRKAYSAPAPLSLLAQNSARAGSDQRDWAVRLLPAHLLKQYRAAPARPAARRRTRSRSTAGRLSVRPTGFSAYGSFSHASGEQQRCVRRFGPFALELIPQGEMPTLHCGRVAGHDCLQLPPLGPLASAADAGARLRAAVSPPQAARAGGLAGRSWAMLPPQGAAAMRWVYPLPDCGLAPWLFAGATPLAALARSGGVVFVDNDGTVLRAGALQPYVPQSSRPALPASPASERGKAAEAPDTADLRFAGPFRWRHVYTQALMLRGETAPCAPRLQPCSLPELRLRGVRWQCWLRPGERLQAEGGGEWCDWVHGAMIFLFQEPGARSGAACDCFYRLCCRAANCGQCKDEARSRESAVFGELLRTGVTPWAEAAELAPQGNRTAGPFRLEPLTRGALPQLHNSTPALRRYSLPLAGPLAALAGTGVRPSGAAGPPRALRPEQRGSGGAAAGEPGPASLAPPEAASVLFCHPVETAALWGPAALAAAGVRGSSGAVLFAAYGGFLYLDEQGAAVGARALCPLPQNGGTPHLFDGGDSIGDWCPQLQLCGPFAWPPECTKALQGGGHRGRRIGRAGPGPLRASAGAVFSAWLHEGEQLPQSAAPRGSPLSTHAGGSPRSQLSSPGGCTAGTWSDWCHGGLVLFCRDPEDPAAPGDCYFRVDCGAAACSECAAARRRLEEFRAQEEEARDDAQSHARFGGTRRGSSRFGVPTSPGARRATRRYSAACPALDSPPLDSPALPVALRPAPLATAAAGCPPATQRPSG